MLSIYAQHRQNVTYKGRLRKTGRSIYFTEKQEGDENSTVYGDLNFVLQTVYVHEVEADEEDACILLDKIARETFQNIPVKIGTIDILESPAGSGKSTSIIAAGYNMLMTTEDCIQGLTYNKSAAEHGRLKTKYESRFKWDTIDSKVFSLFKPHEDTYIDIEHNHILFQKMEDLLGYDVPNMDRDEIMASAVLLRDACNTGDDSSLDRLSRELWNKMFERKWYCFSGLRVLALQTRKQEWIELFSASRVVFTDEAQDLNSVSHELILLLRPTKHLVYCMDKSQRLYGFMKAISIADELLKLDIPHTVWHYYTTFRFGPVLCNYLNEHFLGSAKTFPHPANKQHTVVHFHAPGDDDVSAFKNKSYTYLISSWQNILKSADDLLNEGRSVRMPEDKHNELLECIKIDYSKHESHLFKKLNKKFIADVLSRLQEPGSEVVENEVFICTCHYSKGLQFDHVRIGNCIARSTSMAVLYVSLTRAICEISIPKYKIQTSCSKNKRFGKDFDKSVAKKRRY